MRHAAHRPLSMLLLAALCLVATSAPARAPEVEVTLSSGFSDAEEVCLAIDPTDPDRIFIGTNPYYRFWSIDGGATWTSDTLWSTAYGNAGDPVVVFDADGRLYFTHLSWTLSGHWLDRIVVQKSLDGGVTWNDGAGIGLNGSKQQDKPWFAADRTGSAHHGNLYVAWTEFDSYGSASPTDSTRILFSRSLDQGDTWTDPLRVGERGGNCVDEDETVEGAVPAVGPNGEVYMAWSGHDVIVFDRSFDGGATFGTDLHVASQPGGWDFAVPGIYRCNGMPITACDVSGSPYRGRIYVLFSDQRNGTDDTDVFLVRSDNHGVTWDEPRRVNDDAGAAHQFFPWMVVDPVNGHVNVVFYDRRNTTGTDTEVWMARSVDGGDTFANFPVSTTAFTGDAGVFFGDYIGIDARNDLVHTAWMRLDGTVLSVWSSQLDFVSGVGPDGGPGRRTLHLVGSTVNPAWNRARIAYTLFEDAPIRLEVYDVRGRRVAGVKTARLPAGDHVDVWNGRFEDGTAAPAGIYLLKLEAGPYTVTEKVTLMR